MKLHITKVSAKNFLSIGSNEVELDYQKGIHAVLGKISGEDTTNGVGKSTLFSDAIVFGLYGKSIRDLKVDNIINSVIGEKCEVKVWFEINNIKYRVERGIKPGFLKLFKNDSEEPEELGSKKETQDKLEKILGVSYMSFVNMITLNINSSKPFFRMTAAEKRQLLEDIMNLSIYGKMFDICKKEYNESRNNKKILNVEYDLLKENTKDLIVKYKKIAEHKKNFEKEKEKDIHALKTSIAALDNKIKELHNSLKGKDYDKLLHTLDEKRIEYQNKLAKANSNINSYKREISRNITNIEEIEQNPTCPICATETSSEHVTDHISDLKSENSKLKQKIIKTGDIKNKLNEALDKISKKSTSLKQSKKEYESSITKIKSLEKEKTQLESSLKEKEQEEFNMTNIINKDEVLKSKEKLKAKKEELDSETINMTYGKFLKEILGDKGIKNYVIRKILPVLNTKMNEYLQMLKASYSITFDENLNENFRYRTCDVFSYNNFSSGEKKRIDIALMFTLLDIAKTRSSVDCNILILDEVLDSSMCGDGVDCLMSFLREDFKKKHPDLCTYIITHRPEIKEDSFDTIVVIEKQNSFTKINEVKALSNNVIQC